MEKRDPCIRRSLAFAVSDFVSASGRGRGANASAPRGWGATVGAAFCATASATGNLSSGARCSIFAYFINQARASIFHPASLFHLTPWPRPVSPLDAEYPGYLMLNNFGLLFAATR